MAHILKLILKNINTTTVNHQKLIFLKIIAVWERVFLYINKKNVFLKKYSA